MEKSKLNKLILDNLNIDQIKRVEFRKDINGLRAIAVLSVLIYHAKLNLFPAGFLGVDIFFVISGFLISNIIISELNNSSFKFREFYLRRVKRILPALFFTLLLTLLPAYIMFDPKSFLEYTNSLLSSIFFYSNFYFRNLDFYNAEPAEYMPLLHTWSLSIEEQFYLIFPLIIFLIYKLKKNSLIVFIFFGSIVSLFLNLNTQSLDKFYSIEFRFWEFFAGIIAMLLYEKYKNIKLQDLGYIIIFLCISLFNDNWINDTEPKLLVVFGTFLVLISNNNGFITKIFNIKIFTYIGLSSYSLYLLHQPAFAFARYYEKVLSWEDGHKGLSIQSKLLLIIVLIVFAHYSYKYLELPFLKRFNKPKIIFLLFALVLTSSIALKADSISEYRYKDLDLSYKITTYGNLRQYMASQGGKVCPDRSIIDTCHFKNSKQNKNVVVLGDSHAITLGGFLSENIKENDLFILTGDSCLYIYNIQPEGICDNKVKKSFDEYVMNFEDSIFIYVGNLYHSDYSIKYEIEKDVENTILKLLEKNNTVLIVYQIPKFPFHVPGMYYKGIAWGETISMDYNGWKNDPRKVQVDEVYNNILNENIFRVFPEELLCNSFVYDKCVGAFNEFLFYYDDNHLTIDGAELIGLEIVDIINKINKRN